MRLAKPLLAERSDITSFAQLEELTNALISLFNRWDKYTRGSLSSCPNLSTTSSVELTTPLDVPPMLDIPTTCHKKVKEDEPQSGLCSTDEVVANLLAEELDRRETVTVEEMEVDTYEEYFKGAFILAAV